MKLKMRGSRIINGYPNMWQEKDSADAKLNPKRLKKSRSGDTSQFLDLVAEGFR
jgi:hypothetical protein